MPITPAGGPNFRPETSLLKPIGEQLNKEENKVEENPQVRAQEQRRADRTQSNRSENRVAANRKADEDNKKGLEFLQRDGRGQEKLGKVIDITG